MCEENDDIIEIDEDNLDLPYDVLTTTHFIFPFLPVGFKWLKKYRPDEREYTAFRHISTLKYDVFFRNNLKRIAEKGCHTEISIFCNKRSYTQKKLLRLKQILSVINPHNSEIELVAYTWIVPEHILEEFASKLSEQLGTKVYTIYLEERIITTIIDDVFDGRPSWLRKLTRINR